MGTSSLRKRCGAGIRPVDLLWRDLRGFDFGVPRLTNRCLTGHLAPDDLDIFIDHLWSRVRSHDFDRTGRCPEAVSGPLASTALCRYELLRVMLYSCRLPRRGYPYRRGYTVFTAVQLLRPISNKCVGQREVFDQEV